MHQLPVQRRRASATAERRVGADLHLVVEHPPIAVDPGQDRRDRFDGAPVGRETDVRGGVRGERAVGHAPERARDLG